MTQTLPATERVVQQGIVAGLHTGGQVYVYASDGSRYAASVGDDGAGNPMSRATLMPLFCAARPVLALAAARLTLTHGVDLDAPLAEYVPEYGQSGKNRVTARHVLTHTSGIRNDPALSLRGYPWDEVVAAVCAAPIEPGWAPGSQAAYQALSYWYVIGELVMRVSGLPLSEYLRLHILLPLGLADAWVGMTADDYEQNKARLGHVTQVGPGGPVPAELETPHFCRGHLPFSPRGTARDLARFYDLLLRPGPAAEMLPGALIRSFCVPARTGMRDHAWGDGRGIIDWGLVGVFESRRYGRALQLFGRHSSDSTFGHFGHHATVGFADPDAGIAAAFCLTGMPDAMNAHLRTQAVCTAIYRDTLPGQGRSSA